MKITGDVSAKSYRKQLADKGVFHTDEALAKEIASYIPEGATEVYDPTCGCGALLSVFPDSVKKYGQELDPDMAEYCRQHLNNCEIAAGDTLEKPAFLSRSFPAIVANYPFSIKWDPENACERPFYCLNVPVLPPKGKADYAFLLHNLTDEREIKVLYELLETRSELSRSTIVCSQREPSSWTAMMLNDKVSANAISKRAARHYTVVINPKNT